MLPFLRLLPQRGIEIKTGIIHMEEKQQSQATAHYNRAVMLYGRAVSARSESEREKLLEEAFCEVRDAIAESGGNNNCYDLRDNIVSMSKSLQSQADLINKIPAVGVEG